MQRVRLEPAGQAPATRPRAPAHVGDVLLDLQRAVGNRAVGRILARKTKAPSSQTGLRADAVVREYVAKAVAFRARNADASLVQYALFLGAAANVELAKLGVPDVRLVLAKGDLAAAAQFWADGWFMLVNPKVFTSRPEQVKTLGDLTDQEAVLIADHVFHEARHAEQAFRVARLQAAEGKDPGLGSRRTSPTPRPRRPWRSARATPRRSTRPGNGARTSTGRTRRSARSRPSGTRRWPTRVAPRRA